MLPKTLETYERWYDETEEKDIDQIILKIVPRRDNIDSMALFLHCFISISPNLVNQNYKSSDINNLLLGNEALVDLLFQCVEEKSLVKLRNLVLFKPTYGVRAEHSKLFGRLGITLSSHHKFKKEDLVTNNAELFSDPVDKHLPSQAIPVDIQMVQDRLAKLRIYSEMTPSEDRDLACGRYNEQFALMFQSTNDEDAVTVDDDREYMSLFRLQHSYIQDSVRSAETMSSALKARTFCNFFIHPTVWYPLLNSALLSFKEDVFWDFPMFIRTGDEWTKYTPKTDWSVMIGGVYPFIISNVVSQKDESDEARMLLQAVALSRAGNYLMKSTSDKTFFMVVIYLSKNLQVHRYIVKPENRDVKAKVNILKKIFDLTQPNTSTLFLLEMFSLLSETQSLAKDIDLEKQSDLAALAEKAWAMAPFTFGTTKFGNDSSDDTSEKSEDDTSEESEDDDSWRFNSTEVRQVLDQYDYELGAADDLHPNMAFVYEKGTDNAVEFLKFVRAGSNELQILYHMATIESPYNHVIRPIRMWSVAGGTMVSLPRAGQCLSVSPGISDNLWDIARQLVEGVKLLHYHNIAHLNLNPHNILISETDKRLTIIDFRVSSQLKNRKIRKRVGTEGYMAPEVENSEWYSPKRADLYSCGVIIKELCNKAEDSIFRSALLEIAACWLDSDPKKRPMMSVVLRRLDSISCEEATKAIPTVSVDDLATST